MRRALPVLLLAALAAAEGRDALERAREAAAVGDHLAAIRILRVQAQRAPDARVHLALGEAYVALEAFEQALAELDRARALGLDTPELHHARGNALLGLGRERDALAAYAKGPETARNLAGTAAAQYVAGDLEAALATLDRALQTDPPDEGRLRALRAAILRELGRAEEARGEVERGRETLYGVALDDLYDRLEESLQRRAEGRDGKRWGAVFAMSIGFSDNVTLSPDVAGQLQPGEFTDDDDLFASQSLSGWYRLLGDRRRGLRARGSLDASQNLEQEDFNELAGSLGLDGYCTRGAWTFVLGGSAAAAGLGGDDFSRAYTVVPSALYRWSEDAATLLSVSWSAREFLFTSSAEENRDGARAALTLRQTLTVNRIELWIDGGYGVDDAEGNSAEHDFWSLGAGARVPVGTRVAVFAGVSFREGDYDNPHVRTSFTFPRDDETWSASAGATWVVDERLSVTLRWSWIDNDSNIPSAFSYEQNNVVLTLSLRW